jgi:hypothetical protein
LNGVDKSKIGGAAAALSVGATALASQLPGVSFFTNFAPPNFGALTLMTGGLTLAIFVWVFVNRPARANAKTGIAAVVCAVLLAIVYSALLNWTTVLPPAGTGSTQRFQIGFGLASFSLGPEGLKLLQSSPSSVTPEDLMLAKAAFRPGGPELIWKPWTVTVAWLLSSGFFLLSYLAWSFGLASVALSLTGRSRK